MKFTEGFWEKSEAAHACYAVQAYEVEEIENGKRIMRPAYRTLIKNRDYIALDER